MLTLRCTAKVLKRLRVQPEPSPPPSTTRLGDWYANALYVERQQLIVCVSEVTRLPVILQARSDEPLDARLAGAVGEILGALGLPHPIVREELAARAEVKIAATASRSVLGSLNDYTYLLEGYWRDLLRGLIPSGRGRRLKYHRVHEEGLAPRPHPFGEEADG